MGTRFEIALPARDGRVDDSVLRAAGEAAIDEIEEWHRRLSRFAPDSLLSHINRTAAAAPVRLDREVFDLCAEALAVWRDSDGAFDVTMAPALALRGLADSAVPTRGAGGVAAFIRLDDEHRTIAFGRDDVSIDFGGIAKGHALDRAADLLRAAGVHCALLHGGTSSVLAIGCPPGQPGWRVALGQETDRSVITLADSALSMSDPASQREFTGADHIVDPRGGSAAARVVVHGPSARLADAWTTALAVLGHVPPGFPAGYDATFLRSVH